jgi:hypothetical protein
MCLKNSKKKNKKNPNKINNNKFKITITKAIKLLYITHLRHLSVSEAKERKQMFDTESRNKFPEMQAVAGSRGL